MAAADLKPNAIAERAVKYLEGLARKPCVEPSSGGAECEGREPSCNTCKARSVLGYDPRKATSGLAEYICPECDIGHHNRCTSAHCECSCP